MVKVYSCADNSYFHNHTGLRAHMPRLHREHLRAAKFIRAGRGVHFTAVFSLPAGTALTVSFGSPAYAAYCGKRTIGSGVAE